MKSSEQWLVASGQQSLSDNLKWERLKINLCARFAFTPTAVQR